MTTSRRSPTTMRKATWLAAAAAAVAVSALGAASGRSPATPAAPEFPVRLAALPANTWTLLAEDQGGKAFARVVSAESAGRLYLWGVGGFDAESLAPAEGTWVAALPGSKREAWAGGKWPPFRVYGQGGTDGLRMHLVGGSGAINRVTFYDSDGVQRPSPVYTFNQATWDAKRNRILYYVGGKTFALDPATDTWTDLKSAKSPTACAPLAWASLCYDPINDEAVLFGGGLALNPDGGARTWLYDCVKNTWHRPKLDLEPPLRCTAPMVFDAKSGTMVLFGGYDQTAALNDTWVYRCKERRWEKRTPNPSPPPIFDPATAAIPGGGVLVVGPSALIGTRTHSATWTNKETWVYDVAADAWRPAGADFALPNTRWLTAAGSEKYGVVFLVACGPKRQTYAFRYDASGSAAKRAGSPPGTVKFKFPDQNESLAGAPKPDVEAQKKVLDALPPNQWVEAKPPGTLISKTWSSAICDTDRGEVVYTGGGHSGYSGNDVAHYRVAENRWSLAYTPCFPPYLESTNSCVFGWSYGQRPWSQHTYLWYAYDPVSKMVVYCARPTDAGGLEMQLTPEAPPFIYDPAKQGHWTYVYDPARRTYFPPCLGRPFGNPWDLALAGTPRGVYAVAQGETYLGQVADGAVNWKNLDQAAPRLGKGYNYEWCPIVFDSKRDRLLHFMGTKDLVEVHARDLKEGGAWTKVETKGAASIGREAAYIARHDAVILLANDRLFALDCATGAWRALEVEMPKGQYGVDATMVYDPVHDVCVLLLEKGFAGPIYTYLFRYAPPAGT